MAAAAWTSHPAFRPYRRWLADCPDDAPAVATLASWARVAGASLPDGRTIGFAAAEGRLAALDYEASVHLRAEVPVREGVWHDAMNALVWLTLPRTKAALNAIHLARGRAATPNARDRARDAATLLDESGLVLGCDDASLPPLLAAHAWRRLFVERAEDVRRHLRPVVLGHGLMDKLRAPFRALTATVLFVPFGAGALPEPDDVAALDAGAAACVAGTVLTPASLHPLPVAALQGWDAERLGARLFDDASVFRPASPRSTGARHGEPAVGLERTRRRC